MILFVSGPFASSGFYYCLKKQNKGSEGLKQHLNLCDRNSIDVTKKSLT